MFTFFTHCQNSCKNYRNRSGQTTRHFVGHNNKLLNSEPIQILCSLTYQVWKHGITSVRSMSIYERSIPIFKKSLFFYRRATSLHGSLYITCTHHTVKFHSHRITLTMISKPIYCIVYVFHTLSKFVQKLSQPIGPNDPPFCRAQQ